MADVRLIIDLPQNGARNMAVDETLLMDAVDRDIATLRFYQWSEPTLSLGYFQTYDGREQHAASRDCEVVRRQSGGGAILHDRELTYNLVLPANNPLSKDPGRLYDAVHQAFIAALTGSAEGIATGSLRLRGETASPNSPEPFLCFQRKSPGDIVLDAHPTTATIQPPGLGAGPTAWKVLGSAQRRHRGAILQHGSLLLERSAAAPELPGLRDLQPFPTETGDLSTGLCTELSARLGIRLIPSGWPDELESKAAELTINKYSSHVWTKRR